MVVKFISQYDMNKDNGVSKYCPDNFHRFRPTCAERSRSKREISSLCFFNRTTMIIYINVSNKEIEFYYF